MGLSRLFCLTCTAKLFTFYSIVYFFSMYFGLETCFACEMEGNRDFLFVRHGQTNWGPKDILKGPLDLCLNEEGRKQAQHAYEVTKESTLITTDPLIYSSSLVRALETATIFSSNFYPRPIIQTVDGLKERYYGDYSKVGTKHQIPMDAESPESFQKRVRTTLAEILKTTSTDESHFLIIVSHQKVFEYLTEWLIQQRLNLNQGGVCYFKYDGARYSVEVIE